MASIRRATAADAAALAAFGARTFDDTFGSDNRPEDMRAYIAANYGEEQQRREIENANVITLLVEDAGQLIGYAQMRRAAGELEIARFYVDREWHGRGIAQDLMRAVLDLADRERASRVWLAVWQRNARAIAFYKKHGFVANGTQPFLLGNDLQTDDVMERF